MMSVYSDYLYAAARDVHVFDSLYILDKSYMYELMCQHYSHSVLLSAVELYCYKLVTRRHLHVMCFYFLAS